MGRKSELSESVKVEVKEKPWQSNITSLGEGICHIYRTGKFSDLTIIVKGKKFECHRLILGAGSPKFADMFFNEDHPKEVSLVCPVKGFEILLKFIYTNKLETTDRTEILEAFRVAQKFEQKSLKKKCEELINGWDIHCDNVCSILNLVPDIDSLKERCLEYIKLNNQEVIKSEDFLKTTPLALIDIFSNKCFENVPVLNLLHRFIHWGKGQIGEPEIDKSDLPINTVIRNFLLEIGVLGKLNIQKLSVEEILDFGIQYPDFLTAKESQMFTQFAFKKGQNMPLPDWCDLS